MSPSSRLLLLLVIGMLAHIPTRVITRALAAISVKRLVRLHHVRLVDVVGGGVLVGRLAGLDELEGLGEELARGAIVGVGGLRVREGGVEFVVAVVAAGGVFFDGVVEEVHFEIFFLRFLLLWCELGVVVNVACVCLFVT